MLFDLLFGGLAGCDFGVAVDWDLMLFWVLDVIILVRFDDCGNNGLA